MAWTDDRLWCHPKYVGLSWRSKAVLRHAFEYAGGLNTRGKLSGAQQTMIGANPKVRDELVRTGWWELNGDGSTILIHDWDDHNGLRDNRREKDRERKREYRAKQRASTGQSADSPTKKDGTK